MQKQLRAGISSSWQLRLIIDRHWRQTFSLTTSALAPYQSRSHIEKTPFLCLHHQDSRFHTQSPSQGPELCFGIASIAVDRVLGLCWRPVRLPAWRVNYSSRWTWKEEIIEGHWLVLNLSLCALPSPFIWRYKLRVDSAGFRLKKALSFHDFLKAVQASDMPGHAPVQWYSKISNFRDSSSAHP